MKFRHTKTRVKRKTLIRKLDSAFSRHIRQKYAKHGWVKCFTCGTTKRWTEIQNGHYISRQHLITRYDEDNCRPQCVACNIFRNGNVVTFRENLVKELGEEKVKEIEAARFRIFRVDPSWYEERLEFYSK